VIIRYWDVHSPFCGDLAPGATFDWMLVPFGAMARPPQQEVTIPMPTTAKIPAIDPTAGSVSSLPTLPDGAVPQAPHVLSLGRLERCDLKTVWAHEAFDFTPWLAQRDSLQLLGDTLGLDLEPEAIEEPVGPFRADILCRDVSADQRVIIENQLGRTDHGHLGQLMTYAAGLEAVTIIWIAASFTDEHRAALDWLNRISADSVRLFGLEVELWRIGSSLAAPRFSVVAKPAYSCR
jgi:hypothetical protein